MDLNNHPSNDFQDLIPITAQEEKELKRVHDMLCDYLTKTNLENQLRELEKSNEVINTQLLLDKEQYPASSMKLPSSKLNNSMISIDSNEKRIDEINEEIERLNSNPNKKVSVSDITEILKSLNQKVTRQEVEEMIWECDEDLDNGLNWKEFKLMYCRNNTDRTGLEPSRMFNLTQFLIYDRNRNMKVSVDETMRMLYARHGRVKMEAKLKQIFGNNMPENGKIGGGEIDYGGYIQAVEKIQTDHFFSTTKGKNVASKSLSVDSIKAALSTKSANLQLTDLSSSSRTLSSSIRSNAGTVSNTKLPAINN